MPCFLFSSSMPTQHVSIPSNSRDSAPLVQVTRCSQRGTVSHPSSGVSSKYPPACAEPAMPVTFWSTTPAPPSPTQLPPAVSKSHSYISTLNLDPITATNCLTTTSRDFTPLNCPIKLAYSANSSSSRPPTVSSIPSPTATPTQITGHIGQKHSSTTPAPLLNIASRQSLLPLNRPSGR